MWLRPEIPRSENRVLRELRCSLGSAGTIPSVIRPLLLTPSLSVTQRLEQTRREFYFMRRKELTLTLGEFAPRM